MFSRFLLCGQFLAVTLLACLPAFADEAVTFKYKLEKGATLISRSKAEVKTSQTIGGMNLDTSIVQSSVDVRNVDDITPDGTAKIRTKAVQLKSVSKLGVVGDFEFDSQKPDRDKSSTLGAALTPLYERLVGSELQMEVTSRGVMKSYTGYSQLVGDVIKDNPLAAQFAQGGSDDAAKLQAQALWVVFPDKPVKVGEKWDNPFEMQIPNLGAVKGKETITFLALEDRDGHSVAKLTSSTDISFELNVDMGAAKVSGKISTSNSSGTAEFDVTSGKLLKLTSELTLSGPLSVVANNMTIPVQLSQTISSEVVPLDKVPE